MAAVLLSCGGAHMPVHASAPRTIAASDAEPRREFAQRWIVDDAPLALQRAQASRLPVFVDVWASWCHSCSHMREYVLDDESLMRDAKQAIWLSLDADHPGNAPFLNKYPIKAYPTFLLLDAEGTERARFLGTMDAGQVSSFVRGESPSPALQEVIAASMRGDEHSCIQLGTKLAADAQANRRRWEELNTVATMCSCELDRQEGENVAKRMQCDALPETLKRAMAQPSDEQLTHADDISSAFELLLDAASGDRKQRVAAEWIGFLEPLAAAAPSRSARASFDAHLTLAYLGASRPEKAVLMLLASKRDFPSDFNPSMRLAGVYLKLGKLDEAELEAERAMTLVRGPRTLRALQLRADIAKLRGGSVAEKTVLAQGLERSKGIWLPPSAAKLRLTLEQRHAALR